jgi:ankyrin repeat protein
MAMDNLLQSGGKPDDIVLPSSEIDCQDWIQAALTDSARKGHKKLLEHMLNTGCDVNAFLGVLEDVEDTLTLLHLAILNNQDDVVRFLFERGADINIRSSKRYTALHFAARADNVDIIMLLLDKGMSVNVTGRRYKTPLHSAAQSGSLRAVEVLTRRGAALDETDRYGRTALIDAAWNGEVEVVRFLVENGADVNVSSHYKGSALCEATARAQLELMRYLLDNGADVNGSNSRRCRLPLKIAVLQQNVQTMKCLIERGADVSISIDGSRDRITALHVAIEYGNLQIMDCLITAKANLNMQDWSGATPLFCAVANDKTKPAIRLMENGADVNICTGGSLSKSPLHAAVECGNLAIIHRLIRAGASVNVLDYKGNTPLTCAVARDKTEAVIHLIKNGADVNLCGGKSLGTTALHVAAQFGNLEIMDCLIKAGANVNMKIFDDATPLFCAVNRHKTEAVICLIENGADVNLCVGGPLRRSVLHVAAEKGYERITKYLIKAGANLKAQNSYDATPLFCAVAKCRGTAIPLMENGANVNICAHRHINIPALHVTTDYCHWQIMKSLMRAVSNLNLQNSDGTTSLFSAINLMENVYLCEGGYRSESPLHVAAGFGKLRVIDCLIETGANLNMQNSDGATPLFCAVARDNTKAAIHLVENGADVNICTSGSLSMSALHVAAEYSNLEIMDCLMKARAILNLPNSNSVTPLF